MFFALADIVDILTGTWNVIYYTGTDVIGLTAMRNILENLLEHLGKDKKNTLKHPHPYMTTIQPLPPYHFG